MKLCLTLIHIELWLWDLTSKQDDDYDANRIIHLHNEKYYMKNIM